MKSFRQTAIQFDENLAKALNFTQSTLQTNRAGRMTREQINIVREESKRHLYRHLIKLVAKFGILIAYVIIAFVINPLLAPTVVLLIGGCLFGLPAIFQMIDVFDMWSNLRTDLNQQEIKTVAGRVKFANYGTKTRNVIYVERQTFRDLSEVVLSAFVAGQRYRIYYASATRVILSAEPIDPNATLDGTWEDLQTEKRSIR